MPLVDLLNSLLWVGQNGLPPTPDILHLGCSHHLHSSHCFLFTWGEGWKKLKTLTDQLFIFTMNSCSHMFSLSKISMETKKNFCKLHNNEQWKVVVTFFHFLRSQWKQKDIL